MPHERLNRALEDCPLVAILRGVRPDEVVAIADVLVEAGFTMIEVPLNSPQPLESIARIAKRFGPEILVGAGTVLSVKDVDAVADAGGELIVSPNTSAAVIAQAKARGAVVLPGYFTPSEAFAAIEAGATGLKLFPAEAASPQVLKAHKAVLPAHVPVLAVGGIQPDGMTAWLAAGASGFGLGSGLYASGSTPAEVARRALAYCQAIAAARGCA